MSTTLIFRQLYDPVSSTYSYLLGDPGSRDAVLIDPVFEHVRRDEALARELGLQVRWTLETHVHADHVTAAWLWRERRGSGIALSAASGAVGADRYLEHGDRVDFGARHLQVRATPGHTNGCVSYVLDDLSRAFTGDCLLIRGCGRTDFQQGDAAAMYRSVREQLYTLPAGCLLYPAHDYNGLTVSSVDEEQRCNPRLRLSVGVDDFSGTMRHLGLPHPKQMDVAVPANLRCGRPEGGAQQRGDTVSNVDPDWAPLTFTFGGLWEIQPEALIEVQGKVQLVDVREPAEFEGGLGHIAGSRLIPLGELESRLTELEPDRPIVTICRSGARSARAATMLGKAGYAQVANLAGGLLRWRGQGGVVEGAGE